MSEKQKKGKPLFNFYIRIKPATNDLFYNLHTVATSYVVFLVAGTFWNTILVFQSSIFWNSVFELIRISQLALG